MITQINFNPEVKVSCAPMTVKKGKRSILQVKVTREGNGETQAEDDSNISDNIQTRDNVKRDVDTGDSVIEGTVTWDKVTWTVLDGAGTELLTNSCGQECGDELFSFRVDLAGVHQYLVQVEEEGEVLRCDSVLAIVGKITFKLLNVLST